MKETLEPVPAIQELFANRRQPNRMICYTFDGRNLAGPPAQRGLRLRLDKFDNHQPSVKIIVLQV